jgi:hypothetical protein
MRKDTTSAIVTLGVRDQTNCSHGLSFAKIADLMDVKHRTLPTLKRPITGFLS